MAEVTIQVDEVIGEAGDPDETNLKLTVAKSDVPFLAGAADAGVRSYPELGVIAISATAGDMQADVQETTGESDDPDETNLNIIIDKSAFPSVPDVHADLAGLTTSRALLIPADFGV